MPDRNNEIIKIAETWLDSGRGSEEDIANMWKLYDLACGRRGEVAEEIKVWLQGRQENKQVKKVLELLTNSAK